MKLILLATAIVAASAAGDWTIIAKDLMTENIGITFRNEKEGFIAGGANGYGAEVLHTTDGGLTWNQTSGNFNSELLLLDIECADETVILSGVFGEMYSKDDGQTWKASIGGGQSQSVRYFGKGEDGEKFGCAGSYFGREGAAITTTGGAIFTHSSDPDFFTLARYGAYPSDDVWYLTGGEFPTNSDDDQPAQDDDFPPQSVRAQKTVYMDENGHFRRDVKPDFSYGNMTGSYKAQLVKTTDGGKTWTTQIAVNNSFYFNGIDCTNEQHCCAVGESDAAPFLGAGVWCTFDGQNWNRTFYAPAEQAGIPSLIDIRFANENLGWAVGGILGSAAPKAWFVETTDGGKTWNAEKHTLFGYYALGLEVVNEDLAYAAIDDLITQSTAIAKWTA